MPDDLLTSLSEKVGPENRRGLNLALHSKEFFTKRGSDSVNNAIEENQPIPVELSLVSDPNDDALPQQGF